MLLLLPSGILGKIKKIQKIVSGTLSECQMVWIYVGPDLGPNCMQSCLLARKEISLPLNKFICCWASHGTNF